MPKQIKEPLAIVGLMQKHWKWAAVWTATMIIPLIGRPVGITSPTLALWIACGAFLGGLTSYYLTVSGHAGEDREIRMRRSAVYVVFIWLPFVLLVVLLCVLKPEIAAWFNAASDLHEFFVYFPLVQNLLGALFTFGIVYLLIGAITLRSPTLWSANDQHNISRGLRIDEAPENKLVISDSNKVCDLKVFVSYAWGDTSANASEEDRQRQVMVERLCETLEKEHWRVVRDKTELRYGDLISTFMDTLGQANLVIVVLSAKYLRSPYCVTELYDLYQRARGEKEGFLRRIIPLVLADAQIDTWRDRVAYAKHWENEFKAMEQDFTHLGEADIRLYKAMKRWHNEVGDMLAYVNDVLVPRGFEDIVKEDFNSLRQMLTAAASN